MTGAPYLARFSRDVGYHGSFPLTLDSSDALSGQHRWYPTSREKRARYGAPVPCEGIRAYEAEFVGVRRSFPARGKTLPAFLLGQPAEGWRALSGKTRVELRGRNG